MKLHHRLDDAEAIIGHHFERRDLLAAALTHPSAAEGHPVSASYERLEFLGDSILGAIVALDLFERFPGMDEGGLTRLKIYLVSGKTLSKVAGAMGFADHIVLGESELGTGARGMHSALENVYEAIVGALYVDAGLDAARSFVARTLGPLMDEPDLDTRQENPKSRLQEIAQHKWRCGPLYRLEEEQGPAHRPTFTSVAMIRGRRVGRGVGPTKKESEVAAAADALARLEAGTLVIE